jgi:hypothetical protein
MAFYRCGSGGGTITDKSFTVLYTRDTNEYSYVTPTVSIGSEYTEVVVVWGSSIDSSGVGVTSYTGMTRLYSTRGTARYNTSFYLAVYSKPKGQTASVTLDITGARVLAR